MARLTPAEQIEQSYDDAMKALADYLTREDDAATTIDRLLRILDRDSLRDAITEVLVDARVHPRPKSGCAGMDGHVTRRRQKPNISMSAMSAKAGFG